MSAAGPTPDHFERFDNADEARETASKLDQRREEERAERVELYGTALELFNSRYNDTFAVERHGVEVDFYRPVDAVDVDLSAIRDRELAQRLRKGSGYVEKVQAQQREQLLEMKQGDLDLQEMYDDAMQGTELIRKALSAHAVDESFRDPRVWKAIFPDDEAIGEVFEDFIAEGEPEAKRKKLAALENLLSDGSSQT